MMFKKPESISDIRRDFKWSPLPKETKELKKCIYFKTMIAYQLGEKVVDTGCCFFFPPTDCYFFFVFSYACNQDDS
jgi:hypothetical protein